MPSTPYRQRRPALLLWVSLCLCCSPPPLSSSELGRLPQGPQGAADSPLFVSFPVLDHRIVQVDPASGERARVYYPDRWDRTMDFIIDFAVNRTTLFLLAGARRHRSSPVLLVADLQSGELRGRVPLPPAPQQLTWTCDGRLLVSHGAAPAGPPGCLTLLDLPGGRALPSVRQTTPLQGACISVAPAGRLALVIERAELSMPPEVVLRFSLAELDLLEGRVNRRRALPPGSREVIVGPSGLLYTSHASGLGLMATDGTLSQIDPRSLRMVGRVQVDMLVKQMLATPRHLLLNALSEDGDAWIELHSATGQTELEVRFGERISDQAQVVGDHLLVPLRRSAAMARFELSSGRRLSQLKVDAATIAEDRLGLVRTFRECHVR